MSSNGNVSVSEIRNRACDRAARRSGSRIGNGRGQRRDTSCGHRPRYRLHIAATRPSRLRPLASIAKAHTPPMLLTIRTTSAITLSVAIIRSYPLSKSGSLSCPCDRLRRHTGWQYSRCRRPPAPPQGHQSVKPALGSPDEVVYVPAAAPGQVETDDEAAPTDGPLKKRRVEGNLLVGRSVAALRLAQWTRLFRLIPEGSMGRSIFIGIPPHACGEKCHIRMRASHAHAWIYDTYDTLSLFGRRSEKVGDNSHLYPFSVR